MTALSAYLELIKSKGRPLSEINPGSDEVALSVDVALQAIEILRQGKVPILGGDILSVDDSGKLIYAYQYWGKEYIYLDWTCNRANNESNPEYTNRSVEVAKASIIEAVQVAQRLDKACLVVLVP